MFLTTPSIALFLAVSAAPTTRVAVLLDDGNAGTPASAAIEIALQKRGYEVVASDVSEKMRKVVAPKELLNSRLPEGLSVFEADAVLAGAVDYGKPQAVEGVQSMTITLTIRVIDLGNGQAAATLRSQGVGVGAGGPMLATKAADQAVNQLFRRHGLEKALNKVGQRSGSVTLVVQGIPNREALLELKAGLEKALAGAPAKEIYFAKGLGKLVLGGSKYRSMVGPEIADIIAEDNKVALSVDEVANTRIVATYDRSRTVRVHALVLEPKMPRRNIKKATQLGKYVATQLATFDFARATYSNRRLSRKKAYAMATKIGAQVVVESEILGGKDSNALLVRIIDVETKKPILRHQTVMEEKLDFGAAQKLVAAVAKELPEKWNTIHPTPKAVPDAMTAQNKEK